MAKGDGSITEKSRGVYVVEVCFGVDPVTGKRRRVTKTVRGTKADARRVRDQIRSDYENGLRLDSERVTFREFCPVFTEARRLSGKAKGETIDKDARRLDFICEIIGDVRLKSVNAQTVEALLARIRELREAQGYKCGNSTLRGYYVLIKQLFRKAVDYDLILRNPCDKVDAPPLDETERKSLSQNQAAKLLALIDRTESEAIEKALRMERERTERKDDRDRSYMRSMPMVCNALTVRIGLATGMRLGEVLALEWRDVNLTARKVTVRDSKTKAGRRTIAIDENTVAHLRTWKDVQGDLLAGISIKQVGSTPVLCTQTGAKMDKSNFGHWWKEFRKANGFDDLKFHELRHTQATQLLANGVDVKTVQARLGHADASLTLKWYAHALPENDEKAAQMIGVLFSEKPREPRIIEWKTA